MARPEPQFLKRAESALRDADWSKAVAFLEETALSGSSSFRGAMTVFNQLCSMEKKGSCYRQHVLGNLPPDILAHFCHTECLLWGDALDAKAAAGDLSKLESFFLPYRHRFSQEDKDRALRSAVIKKESSDSKPGNFISLGREYRYETGDRAGNVSFLIANGACPEGANCDLLLSAVSQNNLGIVTALAENQQVLQIFGALAQQRAQEKKFDILQYYLGALLKKRENFIQDGKEILIQNSPVDFRGGQLKTVFNFATQRVTEIFENRQNNTAAMSSHAFDDFSETSLKEAREKLISMGGTPRPLPVRGKSGKFRIDKP